MKDHFEELPDYSRIWVYQANRQLSEKEVDEILKEAQRFVVEWTAHGKGLRAGAKIGYRQFLILSVNEDHNGASGCSIDASVRFIRQLEQKYDIRLLDRSGVAYLSPGKKVRLSPLKEIKNQIDKQVITPDTLIFNNLVKTKGELQDQWLMRAIDSWMKKYFNRNRPSVK